MSIARLCRIGGIISLLSIAVLIACVVQVIRGTSELKAFEQRRFDSILLAQEVRATSSGLTANARAYVSTGDAVYETAYWDLVKIRGGEMPRPKEAAVAPGETVPMGKLLRDAGFTPRELALLEQSVEISAALVLIEDRAMNMVKGLYQDKDGNYTVKKEPDYDTARTLMFGAEYAETVNKIMGPSYEFDSLVQQRISAQSERVQAGLRNAVIGLCAAVAVISVIVVMAVLLLGKKVAAPIHASAGYALAVAEGNLDAESPAFAASSNNEIGQLIDSMRRMVVNLKERILLSEQKSAEAEEHRAQASLAMEEALEARRLSEERQREIEQVVEKVNTVVDRLSETTRQISGHVEMARNGAQTQQLRLGTTVDQIEELRSATGSVASNAGTAAVGSEQSRSRAQEGAAVVGQSTEALNAVHQDINALNSQMEQLGVQAEAIGSVINVINDIADQTNLLALNAAIEAARAGEAGRGFAVVADEVRKLAEKTMEATKEVGSTIGGIQGVAKSSQATMDATMSNVVKASDLAGLSGESLVHIVSGADAMAEQIQTIASAAEEQSVACEHIVDSLSEINVTAEETATLMQNSDAAVAELARQTQELEELMQYLRG